MSAGRRRTARVRAQAKVNLFLRVLAREESGYHQLETLFCRLELADVVTVRTGGTGRTLSCDGPAMPPGGLGPTERNLAFRAAAAYAEATGWPTDFEIAVEKHIPVGGGLGGGSADAGAVLRALDALAPEPLPPERLLALAARLGADVPFLTTESVLALAWGRGERMLALPALPERAVTLVTFGFGVNTAQAFGWLAESRRGAPPSAPRLLTTVDLASWDAIANIAANDFEPVVAQRHPEIAHALSSLEPAPGSGRPSLVSRMSGSGSTVFAVHDFVAPLTDQIVAGSGVVHTRTAGRVEEVSLLE